MDMTIEILIGSRTILINPTVVTGFLIAILLSGIMIIAGNAVKKADPTKASKGWVLFLELVVTTVESLVKATMGAHNLNFAPFVGTLIFFIFTANIIGLLGFSPPTSDFNVTVALAAFTMVMMYKQGIKSEGPWKTFMGTVFGDYPALMPLNVIGALAQPISLSVRLFGNMMSGTILLGLVYTALGWVTPVIAPFLHVYFDIFSGVVQTLIFIMLTMIWTEGMTTNKSESQIRGN